MSRAVVTIVLCLGVIVTGGLIMFGLGSFKQEPAEAAPTERALRVETITVHPEDVQVTLRESGEARAVDVVTISAEVSGTIVEVHPNLDTGRVVPKGETLFLIDPRTYEANVDQAEAQVATLKNTIERLKVQYETDKERLAVMDRTSELAEAEYGRRKELLEKDDVGTVSGLEAQEQALNTAIEATKRMQQSVETYPIQIREAEGQLAAAEAQLDLARLNLSRTRVTAPFNARVKDAAQSSSTMSASRPKGARLAVGQFVSPGQAVLTLANDQLLEISVPINSSDARQWLAFDDEGPMEGVAWFNALKQVDCTIRWIEEKENHHWTGTLNRVEEFDPETRTITVAVRVEGEQALSTDGAIPLVDGMYCEVEIPGRTLQNVFDLPMSAVTFEGNVYLVQDDRPKTAPVQIAWQGNERTYVSQGLEPGSEVIVTRLVNPLENTLVESTADAPEAAPDEAPASPVAESLS